MSTGFQAVQWNRAKWIYDAIVLAGVCLFIGAYMLILRARAPAHEIPSWEDLRIQALGACAFLMITLILCIGPLARLSPRFLPLLYNRRHFGVMAFCVAALHGYSVLDWFLSRGETGNLIAELFNPEYYGKFIGFPMKALGIAALTIFFVMAATSHDYWLAVLTPRIWKAIHMAIYFAYAIAVMHVALGVMQYNYSPAVPVLLGLCAGSVAVLHIIAGWKEAAADNGLVPAEDGWISVGAPSDIADKRAKIVAAPNGERIAVFRDGKRINAVSNVCAHQNGPVGEGEIIDGCITCPWHGWQYRLEDGRSPPPFQEELATYPVRLRDGKIEVHPSPNVPGVEGSIMLPA